MILKVTELLEANKIPIRRKICRIGDGKAIFLPKSWVDLLEEEYGQIKHVAIEVDGELIIKPIIKTEKLEPAK
jgi:antitoxin component of MazEF toxin-antitoxin module